MQVDLLLGLEEVIYGRFPLRVGKEIVVKDFYVGAIGIELDRLYRVYGALLVMDEAERALPDASAGKELDGEAVAWV